MTRSDQVRLQAGRQSSPTVHGLPEFAPHPSNSEQEQRKFLSSPVVGGTVEFPHLLQARENPTQRYAIQLQQEAKRAQRSNTDSTHTHTHTTRYDTSTTAVLLVLLVSVYRHTIPTYATTHKMYPQRTRTAGYDDDTKLDGSARIIARPSSMPLVVLPAMARVLVELLAASSSSSTPVHTKEEEEEETGS